jgi:hypothetical protein
MSTCIEIVEGVKDDVKLLKPRDAELRVLDVVVVGFDLDVGIELLRRFFRNLLWCQRMPSHLAKGLWSSVPMLWTS